MEFQNQRNPILPLQFHIPDSEAHRMPDGKLYVYGSYDELDDAYCSQKYYVVSTADLKNWTIGDAPSLEIRDIPWVNDPASPRYPGLDWQHPTPFLQKMIQNIIDEYEKKGVQPGDQNAAQAKETDAPVTLYAPDCICRDGNYYLYFCLNDDREGVAVSDSPNGPFQNAVQLPCGGIDPAVFLDDDGQAYYYWGQIHAKGVKLNEDMCSFEENQIVENLVTEEEHYFHEGSSMRKIGDTYYYLFADVERGKPTSLGYATGKSPLGPFTYRGILIDNDGCDPKSWNNHGSIECVDGQWYIFYHRSSRNGDKNRRLCVEKIQINADGTIDEVKMTSQGVGEPFAPGETIYGYQACGLKGTAYIDVDDQYGYGEKLTHISDGDEAVFRYIKSGQPWTRLELTCSGSGKISVILNEKDAAVQKTAGVEKLNGAEVATAEKPVGEARINGEAGVVQTVSVPLSAAAGEYELVLRFEESRELEVLSLILR